jgi:GTP-binding protein HflX
VLEKDQLFATLETSVRKITLPDRRTFLLADTVGFVDRLPHHLVRAFHSTLEEALESDLLIHVVDCSNPGYAEQEAVTDRTLGQLGAGGIPVIRAYNKTDLADIRPAGAGRDSILLSAKTGEGLQELLGMIATKLFEDYVRCHMLIPYDDGGAVRYLNERAHIFSTDYRPEGTLLSLECKKADCERLRAYILDPAR